MRARGGGQASTEGVGKRVENPEENVPTYTPAHRGFVKEKGSFFAHGATRLFRGGVDAEFCIDEKANGLCLRDHLRRFKRKGLWVYLNPPFQHYAKFALVAFTALECGEIEGLILLCKETMITTTTYMMDALAKFRHIAFHVGPQRFEDYDKISPWPVSLCVFHQQSVDTFQDRGSRFLDTCGIKYGTTRYVN